MNHTSELMDMVLTGGSPEEVTDKIKEILYTKSSGIIDELKPGIAQLMFNQEEE
jgi:hypothetical protein